MNWAFVDAEGKLVQTPTVTAEILFECVYLTQIISSREPFSSPIAFYPGPRLQPSHAIPESRVPIG